MIPPELADFETYVVAFSGGKDSTGALLWALDNLPPERIRVVYHPVEEADLPEVDPYIAYIEERLGVCVERVRAGDRPLPPQKGDRPRQEWEFEATLFAMIEKRGMWPSAKVRWCCSYLKKWPVALYAWELSRPVLISGQRAEESEARAKLPVFSLGKSDHLTRAMLSTYRPLLYWSKQEVWGFLQHHGVARNPAYQYQARVGCWCCIMSSPKEVFRFCRKHPEIAQVAADLEQRIGHTWQYRHSITSLLHQARAQLTYWEEPHD